MNDSSHKVNAKSLIHPKKICAIFVARVKPFLVLQTGKLQGLKWTPGKPCQMSLVCLVGSTAHELTSFVDTVDPSPVSSQRQKGPWSSPGPDELQGSCQFQQNLHFNLWLEIGEGGQWLSIWCGCYPNLSLFSKQEVLLKKRSWVKDLPFSRENFIPILALHL